MLKHTYMHGIVFMEMTSDNHFVLYCMTQWMSINAHIFKFVFNIYTNYRLLPKQ